MRWILFFYGALGFGGVGLGKGGLECFDFGGGDFVRVAFDGAVGFYDLMASGGEGCLAAADMPMFRLAAEMEPCVSMSSSRRTLPGPSWRRSSKSMRRVSRVKRWK